jgi:hypothetical protein
MEEVTQRCVWSTVVCGRAGMLQRCCEKLAITGAEKKVKRQAAGAAIVSAYMHLAILMV